MLHAIHPLTTTKQHHLYEIAYFSVTHLYKRLEAQKNILAVTSKLQDNSVQI